ncbi:MAG: hypothetical protein DRP45_00655 [Candidatus Zixiibacteriota bacterium]|nr:MAG: hypothetical protein DRP45_00655 [candidate division Zixibacteria bacterium]
MRDYVPVIDCFSQESPVATELRRLLSSMKKLEGQSELKSILVTSATESEGKSTICSLLSITSARRGYKTLLVDCDLRRPMIHAMFALERRHGIVEVLSEGVAIKSVIKKTSLDNLDVVTSGKVTSQPTELFDSRAIEGLIRELKFYYDFIFVDTPPVIPVSDPMLLAQELDGTLFVVRAGATAREVLKRAADIMTSNNVNLLGAVLNDVKGNLPSYYDSSNYNYDYKPSAEDRKIDRKENQSYSLPKPVQKKKNNQGSNSTPISGKQLDR